MFEFVSGARLVDQEVARPRYHLQRFASSRRPICLPTLLFATVVILSTMRRDGLLRPLVAVGSIGIRNSSAAVGSPVKGQIVMDSVASNLLSCRTITGRGLPA